MTVNATANAREHCTKRIEDCTELCCERRGRDDLAAARGVTNAILLSLCGWGLVVTILLAKWIWG